MNVSYMISKLLDELVCSSPPSRARSVPLWNLTSKLKSISLPRFDPRIYTQDDALPEQSEEAFTSFTLPSQAPVTVQARHAQHASIACRMLICAAKGGKLRQISCSKELRPVFAMRTMLPHWVRIEEWECYSLKAWECAALCLRALLAHASLWLGNKVASVPRYERRLTAAEVQGLQAYFEKEGTPRLVKVREDTPQPVERYLPWLEEDADLAQKVADAWNGVVERGGADLIKCRCDRCMTS